MKINKIEGMFSLVQIYLICCIEDLCPFNPSKIAIGKSNNMKDVPPYG